LRFSASSDRPARLLVQLVALARLLDAIAVEVMVDVGRVQVGKDLARHVGLRVGEAGARRVAAGARVHERQHALVQEVALVAPPPRRFVAFEQVLDGVVADGVEVDRHFDELTLWACESG
jgi:hypothetical protein